MPTATGHCLENLLETRERFLSRRNLTLRPVSGTLRARHARLKAALQWLHMADQRALRKPASRQLSGGFTRNLSPAEAG